MQSCPFQKHGLLKLFAPKVLVRTVWEVDGLNWVGGCIGVEWSLVLIGQSGGNASLHVDTVTRRDPSADGTAHTLAFKFEQQLYQAFVRQ